MLPNIDVVGFFERCHLILIPLQLMGRLFHDFLLDLFLFKSYKYSRFIRLIIQLVSSWKYLVDSSHNFTYL